MLNKDYSRHGKDNEFERNKMEGEKVDAHLLQKSRDMMGARTKMGVARTVPKAVCPAFKLNRLRVVEYFPKFAWFLDIVIFWGIHV